MRKGLAFVPPLLVFRLSPHCSRFSRREERKSYLNMFRNLAVYSFCLQMLTLWVFLYSGFRSPTLSWGLCPVLPFSCTPLERYLWAWFQLCDLLWYSSGQWKNLAALPSSPPIWKKHISPIAALSFAFVIVGYSSLSVFVLLQATVSQKSLCLNMPTNPKVYFLALWSSWLCISWSNVGLVRFFLSGSFLFLKYTLVVQRSLWASISWLGSTNAIKSKLDHLFSRKASSIISSLEFTSSFTLAGNG